MLPGRVHDLGRTLQPVLVHPREGKDPADCSVNKEFFARDDDGSIGCTTTDEPCKSDELA